ncbi:MAG: PD-(D/E)XK nuclease family protein [Zestosphaera sp.]
MRSLFAKYIEGDLSKNISPNDSERLKEALKVLEEILSKTAHVPTVTSVAIGAALCSFKARLIEAIGAIKKQHVHVFKDRIMGEGSDIHRVLALASLLYFKEGHSIPKSVKKSIEELGSQREFIKNQGDHLLKEAIKLLEYLINQLPSWTKLLGVELKNLNPIVEQTLIDYEVRLRGIPDLILEDCKNRKAIVIEWKTGGSRTPYNYEIAQVLAYAILEARRLGYPPEELERVILGHLDDDGSVRDFSILPVIIRPTYQGEIYPHPSLAPPNKVRKRYDEMKNLIQRILIEADHLTVLLTNQKELTGKDPEDLRVTLLDKGIDVNVLRYTPHILKRGVPKEQKTWPCANKKGKVICEYNDACRFYFGEFGKKEDYERILWGLRFEALGKREEMLAVYRGLHEFFRYNLFIKKLQVEEVLKKLQEGNGIIVELDVSPKVNLSTRYDGKSICREILVLRGSKELFRGGLDVIESVNVDVDRGIIIASRKVHEYEKKTKYGFLPRLIREGAPVMLSFMDSWSPLLSTNIFGRVDSVNIRGEDIEYELGFPSRLLELQRCVFAHYIRNDLIGKYLLAEVNVDLTRADLESIDAIHRCLDKCRSLGVKDIKEEIDRDELMKELKILKVTKKRLSRELGEDTSLGLILREILARKR